MLVNNLWSKDHKVPVLRPFSFEQKLKKFQQILWKFWTKFIWIFEGMYFWEDCLKKIWLPCVFSVTSIKKKCFEVVLWRPHKLRLFRPLFTPLFHEHLHGVFGVLLYAILESCDTNFAGQVVYKPWGLSVSSEALMPITAILIPAADCVLLLHQLVIGPVTVHLM